MIDGRRYDEMVGGVAMQVFQLAGQQGNAAIKRDFDQAGLQPVGPPALDRHGKDDASAFCQQGDFPETDGADSHLPSPPLA